MCVRRLFWWFSLSFPHINAIKKINILLAFERFLAVKWTIYIHFSIFIVRNNGHLSNNLWVIYVHYFPLATDLEYVKKILTILLMSLRIILPPKNGALFELGKVLVRKMPKIDIFGSCRLSSISVFLTIDGLVKTMQWGCQNDAMRLSKLWNGLVRAMLWGRQMPQVSVSKHSYEGLR